MRRAVQPAARPRARVYRIPMSTRGLVTNQSRANADPNTALVLRNIWPSQRDGEVRGGLLHSATVPAKVESLFAYNQPGNNRFFAADATGIYDITALSTTVAAAVVSGRTSGLYSTQQMGTVGGEFLMAVNGSDPAQLFDGTSWVDATITGVPSNTLSHVWLTRSRLFFVQKDTLDAWFLPVDSIGGAAQRISLAGVFQRGGSLLFGATWSLDAGDGIDDKAVFVTTEGEVAIYEGSDPSSTTDWNIVGLYEISRPMGQNATMQAGGDLAIATVAGMVPLSEAINKDPEALSLAAISRPIEPLWVDEVRQSTQPWQIAKWSEKDVALVTSPDSASPKTLAVSLETGAWMEITGWASQSVAVFEDRAYIGLANGKVMACDQTGTDDGEVFVAEWMPAYRDFGSSTAYKSARMCRASFLSDGDVEVQLSVSTDYRIDLPLPGGASPEGATIGMIWGASNWGEARWGAVRREADFDAVTSRWESVSGQGQAITPALQITSGGEQKLNIRIVELELSVEDGYTIT